MNRVRVGVLAAIVALIALVSWLDLGHWFSLEALHRQIGGLQAWAAAQPVLAQAAFFGTYVLIAALSIPGAAIFTLAAGALFGLIRGIVLVSFASTIGATLACVLARFLFRDFVEGKFSQQLDRINAGLVRDGGYYLFGLRLVPVFPFFVINLVAGLTRLPIRTFFWVSQLGMLPGTAVFVNAGTRLADIRVIGDILAPGVALAFALLGLFPLIARRLAAAVIDWHRRSRG